MDWWWVVWRTTDGEEHRFAPFSWLCACEFAKRLPARVPNLADLPHITKRPW